MKVIICNCNPGISHQPITDTDAAKIRRVRRDCLEDAVRWDKCETRGDTLAAICARYTAYQCLVRLRELRNSMEVQP
jgi:hypothetical protein